MLSALRLNEANLIGWGLALAGVACGIVAAHIHGGAFEAWTAAGIGLNGLAIAWGRAFAPASLAVGANSSGGTAGAGGAGTASSISGSSVTYGGGGGGGR